MGQFILSSSRSKLVLVASKFHVINVLLIMILIRDLGNGLAYKLLLISFVSSDLRSKQYLTLIIQVKFIILTCWTGKYSLETVSLETKETRPCPPGNATSEKKSSSGQSPPSRVKKMKMMHPGGCSVNYRPLRAPLWFSGGMCQHAASLSYANCHLWSRSLFPDKYFYFVY